MADKITLIECPRDAWQGLPQVIPTVEKVAYHRALMTAGFQHLDAVSFVSPTHVPQMADSEDVMRELSSGNNAVENVEIIGIVVNQKGLERAQSTGSVTTIGYPHSLSDTFLRQNQSIAVIESRELVLAMETATDLGGLEFVAYLSMAFGNPYGEDWSAARTADEVAWLAQQGVTTVSLADTVGKAPAEDVSALFSAARAAAPNIEIGVHLHSRSDSAAEKVIAAYEAGCRRFDGALTGLGGCPFADDEMVGNIPTEIVVETLAARGTKTGTGLGVNLDALEPVIDLTRQIRSKYGE